MPKKPKSISLVSYGAESQSEDEESNENSSQSDASVNSSRRTDSEEENESDHNNGRSRFSNSEDDVSNSANNRDDNDENKSDTERHSNVDKKSPQSNADEDNDSKEGESNEKNQASEESATSSKYTLENGFPEGCDKIKLPPAPKAPCSASLQNKIIQVVYRMENYNYSINDDIESKKKFKNPSIYEKLIEAYEIDEYGSSFPTHVDLKDQGYMYYDELDKVQREEWAKRDKEKKERTKIEMVSGTKKTLK